MSPGGLNTSLIEEMADMLSKVLTDTNRTTYSAYNFPVFFFFLVRLRIVVAVVTTITATRAKMSVRPGCRAN